VSIFQFLLDENVDPILQTVAKRRWPEVVVWIVGERDAPAKTTSDPEILLWCEAHGFSLITNNRTSMPIHLQDHLNAGRHVPGIFILKPEMTWDQTAEQMALLSGAALPEEYSGRINYFPVG
jgi:uncharacterized protein DUF5615